MLGGKLSFRDSEKARALSRMKHENSHSVVLRKQARSEVEINRRGREEHYEQSGINR